MRAMQLPRPAPAARGPLQLATPADPTPADGELVLRVAACAVCRTDLQLAEGDLRAHRLPITPGHQAVGRVVAVGPRVSGWRVGDRAGVTWLAGFCGHCEYCRSGRQNLCRQATFTGWDRDGGFAELMTVRADVAVRLPDGLADADAAPLLCGGVIGYRALRLAGALDGRRPDGEPLRLGLYGFGASASLAIQVAVHAGCRVHVASRAAEDLERARGLGASSTGGYADPPPNDLDAVVTFAPVGSVVVDGLRALAPGGTVVINAIHLDGIPAFDYDLLWEERGLRSVANVTPLDATEFLELAGEIGIETTPHPYPMAEANRALVDLSEGRIGAGAAVLVMDEAVGPSGSGR